MYSKFLILAVWFCTSVVQSRQLHEHMTKEEVELVFKVNHDEVYGVDYEVVPVLHKFEEVLQSANPTIHLSAFDRNYTLYLEKNEHTLLGSNTPLFTTNIAYGEENKKYRVYGEMRYPMPENFNLYHDLENRAAVSLHTDGDKKVHVHGTVGDDIIIRSLPSRVHREVFDGQSNFTNDFSTSNFPSYETTHHVVIKRRQERHTPVPSSIVNQRNEINEPSDTPHSYPTTDAPSTLTSEAQSNSTVYLETLIVVDFETYKIHAKNTNELAKYIAAFWNGVDLRFRELDNPKVRLNIAGLIVPMIPSAHKYMYRFYGGNEVISATDAIRSIGQYFIGSRFFSKDKYDIIAAMTFHKLGILKEDRITISTNITGGAPIGRACSTSTGESLILVKDKGGFEGITTAAHELAHTLSAEHDRSNNSRPCSELLDGYSDGYLMSYKRKTSRGMHWSECSKTAMRNFLTSENATCLRNKPDVGTPYKKILPGSILSRDDQCKRSLGYHSYKRLENNCAVLYCLNNVTMLPITQNRPPAEGSYCGEGKICLDGECVNNPEL